MGNGKPAFPWKSCSKLYPCCIGKKRNLPDLLELADNKYPQLRAAREDPALSGQVEKERERGFIKPCSGGD